MPNQEAQRKLVELWGDRARRSEGAHYQTAARYSSTHTFLTLIAVALSAVTASGLFASNAHSDGASTAYNVTFGVLGIIAAIAAGVDRGQRYAERSEQHRAAGAGWAIIVNTTERRLQDLEDGPLTAKVFEQLD